MTVLERVLKESDFTLKDLIIFIVVDKSELEDILNDNNIKLTMFERFDLKDELYNAIMISNL